MKLLIQLLTIILFIPAALSQTTVSGTVTDTNNLPLSGANVFIEGTYDGATTGFDGSFSFNTNLSGEQLLVISYISFKSYKLFANVNSMQNLKIRLKQEISDLETVMLTAGAMDASDNSKAAVLTPMDIVTTAGALGDVVGALQTLPGTSSNTNDGRLFVRGGNANETQVFIDGLRVFQPFFASANNTPTRGRNSPFLFKGVNFSTGGYSAEYGQALSSVLNLNTIDTPKQDEVNLQFMSVGGGGALTKKWDKNSISLNTQYINLAPYQELIKQNINFTKAPEIFGGETVFRQQYKNGLFNTYAAISYTNFGLIQEDINASEGIPIAVKNRNSYLNASYKGNVSDSWKIQTGFSFSNDFSDTKFNTTNVENSENAFHAKLKLKKRFSNYIKLSFGAEQFYTQFKENGVFEETNFQNDFNNGISAAFAEGEFVVNDKFAAKSGFRLAHTSILNETTLSPRISLAYKTSKHGQLALAYGDFYQNPNNSVLKFTDRITSEKASHYLLNYLYKREKQLFRAEVYHKKYDDFIKFNTELPQQNSSFSNSGNGKASGLDLFWRDGSSIKNFEYWASYSYLDTKRNFQNYTESTRPPFATKHNFSLVTKYFHTKWRTQFGATYNFSSGRSYTNPNRTGFLNAETRSFNDLSINAAYLITQQKILFFSISNVLGFNNIFDYQYTTTPNANGIFNRRAIGQPAKRFFFVGFFWTISKDKSKNQLENL